MDNQCGVKMNTEQVEGLFDSAFGVALCAEENVQYYPEPIGNVAAAYELKFQSYKAFRENSFDGIPTLEIVDGQSKKGARRVDVYAIQMQSVNGDPVTAVSIF